MEGPDNSQCQKDKSGSTTNPQPLYKRKLERIDEGIFRYAQKDGDIRYAVRFNHQQRDWRKVRLSQISLKLNVVEQPKRKDRENRFSLSS